MGPNVLGNVARAVGTGNALAQFNRNKRLDDVYKQHGQGIAQGNQNALAALAGVDPMAALNVQDTRQTMDLRQQGADRQAQVFDLEMKKYAASLDAAEAAKQAEAIRQGVFAASSAQTPERWDAIATQFGAPDLVGQFENRQAWLNSYASAADILEQMAGPKPPDEYGRYVQEEQAAGREPLSRIDYAQAKKGSEIIYGPDGQPIVQRGPAGMKPFTEGQSKDNVYSTRARGALQVLEPVAGNLANRGERIAESVPLGIGREFQSEDFQVAQQAGTEFLQAILRKDTGAAITQQEEDSYGRVYLPQPGDGPAVIEAKRQARVRAVNAIEAGMSPQQMLVRDRALINTARESGQQVKERETGGPDVPEQPPAFLDQGDMDLWQYMTPLERQAILGDYEGQQ